LQRFQILVVPGGFTYGDDVAAGKIRNQLAHFLGDALRKFRDSNRPVLGICNGFQAILQGRTLGAADEDGPGRHAREQRRRQVRGSVDQHEGDAGELSLPQGVRRLTLPIAHGEGRFVCRAAWMLQGLEQTGQVVLPPGRRRQAGGYPVNPNGSQADGRSV
jgi:phosphoribosylformylglycinamidine synthase